MAAANKGLFFLLLVTAAALVHGRPQELRCPNGEPFNPDFGTVNEEGCTVGYCDKVCPTGAFTNDNRQVTFRGNKGPAGTGSNGNAGPLNALNGLPVDPAAESLKRQQLEFIRQSEEQIRNAERIAQTGK